MSTPPRSFIIGLGSNEGPSRRILIGAVGALALEGEGLRVSSLYRTRPVGGGAQPDYLNAAVGLRFRMTPLQLLELLQSIEGRFGRVRRERWGPRTLDLDVLWAEGPPVDLPGLQIPHARLASREFALLPLLDVAPTAVDPRTGEPFAALVSRVSGQGVERIEGKGWSRSRADR